MTNPANELPQSCSDESPLIALIEKPITDMTADELREHINSLRAVRTSASVRKAATTKRAPKKPAIDVSEFFDL